MSEELNLHRETMHLALNYIDRFLARMRNFEREFTQLLGVTALFIAAKAEEVRPPAIREFANVTDGACDIPAIHGMELVILEVRFFCVFNC